MGISGLLPLLKSIHKHGTLKKFAGQTIGIDAYGWLHRGTVACAVELALDKPTTKYVDFAMGRVRMLLDFGITPYLVFDGDALPSKAGTNKERRKRRDESKALGLELYNAGKLTQAHQELQKAADVTPYMARQLIEELKRLNVQYVVAPYEADAQLAYLERKGIINGILSEDSDLLVFGAKRLLTKLNQYGECVEIERSDFASCRDINLAGWSDAMFRCMAILSGCDYLPNINKMGLKTAYRFVRKYKDAEKVLRMIQFEGQFTVPAEYLESFRNAELTFLHHRVFCPIEQKLVFLTDLSSGTKEADLPFLGLDVDPETAVGVACGDLDPKTKEPIPMKKAVTASRPPLRDQRRQTYASSADLKSTTLMDSFLKRQPLAELDPNSLTPSPSQRRLLQLHASTSWEPRLVSSAPQLRRTTTSLIAAGEGRRSHPSTDRSTFLARASTISTYQPPKRQRLCSETEETSPSKEEKQSPFFANHGHEASPLVQKKGRGKKARKSDFEVWSDDSLDGILLGLPEVQQVASPDQPKEPIAGKGHRSDVDKSAPEDGVDAILQSSPAECGKSHLAEVRIEEQSFLSEDRLSPEDATQETAATSVPSDDEDGKFCVSLFELHEPSKREAFLKTFVSQSPSQRAKALESLVSPSAVPRSTSSSSEQSCAEAGKPPTSMDPAPSTTIDELALSAVETSAEEKKISDIRKTFAYSSPAQQAFALKSLGQSETDKIELGRAALPASASVLTASRGASASSLQRLRDQALRKTQTSVSHKAKIDSLKATAPADSKEQGAVQTPKSPIRNLKGSEDMIVPDSDDDSDVEEPTKATLNLKAYVFTTS